MSAIAPKQRQRLNSPAGYDAIPDMPEIQLPEDVLARFPSLLRWQAEYNSKMRDFLKKNSVASSGG
jgi:hypothetical protein